jgi:non-ribosomal peptide synthetase component F
MLLTEKTCLPLLSNPATKWSAWIPTGRCLVRRPATSGADRWSLRSCLRMCTSGSTGKPKGAVILHRGLVNYLWWAIRTCAVERGHLVPIHTSISFDLTVTSLSTTPLGGGKVELLPEDVGVQKPVGRPSARWKPWPHRPTSNCPARR